MSSSSSLVMYQGVKYFWQSNKSLEIALVLHQSTGTVEIISYDPQLDYESARIYLKYDILILKLDKDVLDCRIRKAKESSVRSHQDIEMSRLICDVRLQVAVEYILNRLFLDDKGLSLEYCSRFGMSTRSKRDDELFRRKPPNVIAYSVSHRRLIE